MSEREAAILAGAKAWHQRIQASRKDAGRLSDEGRAWQWEDLTESDRRAYLALAREVVTPALDAIEKAVS